MAEFLTLKKSNCKNCYKCIRHCPVKSIRFSGNQAHIIKDECILCGHCFVACPQNAKQIVDDTEKVRVMLQSGDPVVVSLAPSFIANYPGVGIASVEQTAESQESGGENMLTIILTNNTKTKTKSRQRARQCSDHGTLLSDISGSLPPDGFPN